MKQIYYYSLTLLFFLFSHINAQNLWGVDASIDLMNAEFQNEFIETGTTNNYSINNWTALSINDTDGTNNPGSAFWTRSTLGYSQGAFWGGRNPISSPSQANGVAIFDSGFLDNNGNSNGFGTGTSPSSHKGELISPRIDLTGNTDVPLSVKFFSFYRNFEINELSVSFSTDDGTTWGNSIDYRTLQTELTQGFITLDLPFNSTQGVTNLTQCRIKFTFDGSYYFAIIDDITILASNTMSVNDLNNFKSFISIYPNPSKEFILISGLKGKIKYTVYNSLGLLIKKGITSKNDEEISIRDFADGLYFLKLENENLIKFIKQ